MLDIFPEGTSFHPYLNSMTRAVLSCQAMLIVIMVNECILQDIVITSEV